ncbi:MAG TPA: hypothetical protein VIT22_07615 [Pseudoxanthomonas sp.]
MRTLIIITIGLAVMALMLWLTKPAKRRLTAWIFIGAWLLFTAFNLRTGLSHGYSLQEELPIHLVLFGVPALAAWWFSRRPK